MTTEAEIIDVKSYNIQGLEIPTGKRYLVTINGDPYIFDNIHVTGRQVLEKIRIVDVEGMIVYQLIAGSNIEIIDLDEKVNLAKDGFERFVVKESTVFNYFVDNDPETSDKKQLTANEILKRAAYKPSDYYLVELHENGQQTSYQDRPTEPITFTHHPKKRFISIYRGNMPVS